MAPTLSASSSCGPAGNSVHSTVVAQRLQLLLEEPLRLQKDEGAVFLEADADGLVVFGMADRGQRRGKAAGDHQGGEAFQESHGSYPLFGRARQRGSVLGVWQGPCQRHDPCEISRLAARTLIGAGRLPTAPARRLLQCQRCCASAPGIMNRRRPPAEARAGVENIPKRQLVQAGNLRTPGRIFPALPSSRM